MAKKDLTFIEQIEDSFGEGIVYKEKNEKIDVISTGSIALDISLGIGGIPRGRISEIYGPESASKTTLCLSLAKNCTGRILYVDQEQGLDHRYIKAVVGDINFDKFILAQPETGEQALGICEMGIQSGNFDLVVLDSIGALAPAKEKEKELGDKSVALTSSILTQFLRRNAFAIRGNNVAMVFVNQIRANIGVMFGPKTNTPGGYALQHYASIRLQLTKMGKDYEIKDGDELIGVHARFVVKKNKVAVPFKSFNYPLVFGKGIDRAIGIVDFAKMLGIIIMRGAYFTFEGEQLGQGIVKTLVRLREENELLDKIEKVCYNTTIGLSFYKERSNNEEIVDTKEDILDGAVSES